MSEERQQQNPALGCFVRLFWMIVGNLILVFSAAAIVRNTSGAVLSSADLAYWATVAGMITARYVDVRVLGGTTSDGQRPATLADWKRYSGILVVVTLVVWVLLRAAAHYRS